MSILTIAVAAAYVQSVARLYPEGVSLVSPKREGLLSVSIQNLDNKNIYFWHGTAYESLAAQTAGTELPLDPASWTPTQRTNFSSFVQEYGEVVTPGSSLEPNVAQRLQLYSVVPIGTAKAHVKIGHASDPSIP